MKRVMRLGEAFDRNPKLGFVVIIGVVTLGLVAFSRHPVTAPYFNYLSVFLSGLFLGLLVEARHHLKTLDEQGDILSVAFLTAGLLQAAVEMAEENDHLEELEERLEQRHTRMRELLEAMDEGRPLWEIREEFADIYPDGEEMPDGFDFDPDPDPEAEAEAEARDQGLW